MHGHTQWVHRHPAGLRSRLPEEALCTVTETLEDFLTEI